MTTIKFLDLEINDVISFTNKVNHKVVINVTRVEEKSWYSGRSRNSYGTLKGYMKYPDFKITKNAAIRKI